jgi:hypothetical protein
MASRNYQQIKNKYTKIEREEEFEGGRGIVQIQHSMESCDVNACQSTT